MSSVRCQRPLAEIRYRFVPLTMLDIQLELSRTIDTCAGIRLFLPNGVAVLDNGNVVVAMIVIMFRAGNMRKLENVLLSVIDQR